MSQLEEIIKDTNSDPRGRNVQEDKIRYRKIQRELRSKQSQFDRMDKLDYVERCRLSELHPAQTTLERWSPSVCSSGPPKDI